MDTQGMWRRSVALSAMLACGGIACAQDAAGTGQGNPQTVLWHSGDTTVQWHAEGGLNLVAEHNLFWDLSRTFDPQVDFGPDTHWLEGYFKPGLSFVRGAGDLEFHGLLSAVGSFTRGTDAFDATNQGATTLESGYIGLRTRGQDPRWDVSLGPRELVLGDGMLIANGGESGFERGALKFGPRKAWRHAAIARFPVGPGEATAFRIAPNELRSNDGHNRLAGLDWRWDGKPGNFGGASYIHVLESTSPYIQAAPGGVGPSTIIPGGRHGTKALNLYFSLTPTSGRLRNWLVSADLAIERNHRIDMRAWGGRVRAGYTFHEARWTPSLTYTFQTFSGDDPDTRALERFDPMYYEGSPGNWASGSKSSMVFINTNVRSSELAIAIAPTQRDTLTLRLARLDANELNSPLQFGQATRVERVGARLAVVDGVPHAHLSDDVFLEYMRIINPHTFLTIGSSVSFPGKGIRALTPRRTPDWMDGFVTLVVSY